MASLPACVAVLRPSLRALPSVLHGFGLRGWLVVVTAAAVSAGVMGIPTVMFNNPWFVRMTATRPQDYVVWVGSALLIGVITGTYAGRPRGGGDGRALAGGLLAYLAIGCPICNKLVVVLLGVSGALSVFGPAQLVIGIASLLLLGWTLLLRVDALSRTDCVLPLGTGTSAAAGDIGLSGAS